RNERNIGGLFVPGPADMGAAAGDDAVDHAALERSGDFGGGQAHHIGAESLEHGICRPAQTAQLCALEIRGLEQESALVEDLVVALGEEVEQLNALLLVEGSDHVIEAVVDRT